jgi:hypothetical protein
LRTGVGLSAAISGSAGRQSNSARENKVLKGPAVITHDKAGLAAVIGAIHPHHMNPSAIRANRKMLKNHQR